MESRNNSEQVRPDMSAQKEIFREVTDKITRDGGPELRATVNKLRQAIRNVINGRPAKAVYEILFSADSYLRKVATPFIADMFYVRAQQAQTERDPNVATILGYVPSVGRARQRLENLFLKMVGDAASPEVIAALNEAHRNVPTDQLNPDIPLAVEVRKFYDEVYETYIKDSNAKIGKRKNYVPVMLDLEAIAQHKDAFIDLILTESNQLEDDIARANVTKAVIDIIEKTDSNLDFLSSPIWDPNPQSGRAKARKLTSEVDPVILLEKGFLRKPEEGLAEYINGITKRVEWDRHTKDSKGRDMLGPALAQLPPDRKQKAQQIIETYLGFQKAPLSPFWRDVNSWAQVVQFYTILPFVTLASLTELAGPLINSKDFNGLIDGLKTIKNSNKDYKEAELFARD